MDYPFVSIIIPVYNEVSYIKDCLNSVINFDYPQKNCEIIIVDGNSQDGTVQMIESYITEYENKKIITNVDKVVPISMNMGIAQAKGDYIIRLDAHCYYPSNYISELIKNAVKYHTDNIGTVCLTDVKTVTYVSNAIKFVLSNKFGVGNSLFRIGIDSLIEVDTVPFGCFTKEILQKVGGYDERLVRNQDIEINKRIKKAEGKIYLIPNPKCIYFAREDLKSFALNNFSNGKWNILTSYYTNDIKSLSLRHYIPLLFMISLFIPTFLMLLDFKFLFFTLFVLKIYLISIIIIALRNNRNAKQVIAIISAFITLHFTYGFGSIIGLFIALKYRINGK